LIIICLIIIKLKLNNNKKWIVATYIGIVGATCTVLLISGLVSFQWIEDGTAKSLWVSINKYLINNYFNINKYIKLINLKFKYHNYNTYWK